MQSTAWLVVLVGATRPARFTLPVVSAQDVLLATARVHMLLGDVATEQERFTDALEEFKTALKLRTPLLDAKDR